MTARTLALVEPPSWTEEPTTRTKSLLRDSSPRDSILYDSGVWTIDELERSRNDAARRAAARSDAARSDAESAGSAARERARRDRLLFETYAPLVRRIAARTIRRLPRSLTMEDVISAGWIGMAEALSRRAPGLTEEQFEACASYRVRGAILDYLRLLDPLSRRLRAFSKRAQEATRNLSQELGRPPSTEELAKRLDLPLEHLEQLLLEVQEATAERCDPLATDAPSSQPSPESSVSERETWRRLEASVEALPERLRLVLTLHYQQLWSLRAIGESLGVTESRACQLHGEAVRRVRAHFEGNAVVKARRGRRAE